MKVSSVRLNYRIKLSVAGLLAVLVVAIWLSNSAVPSSPELYDLKRLQEKVFVLLRRSPRAKVSYYSVLLNLRLDELTSVVTNREYDYVLTASQRYYTTAGQLTELIVARRLTDSVAPTLEKFSSHQKTIQQLVDSYPAAEDGNWKFVQDDFNYLSIYANQLRTF